MIRSSMSASLRATAASAAIVAAAGALAADLPASAPPPYAPPPVFSWTGAYIGGQLGYEWGTSSSLALNNATGAVIGEPGYTPNGFTGGIHAGHNYQISQVVVGFEHSIDGSTYRGSGLDNSGAIVHATKIPYESSLRGRLGVAWDHALIYATGGATFGEIDNTSFNRLTGGADSFDHFRLGWTLGGGIDYALSDHWIVRAEYRHADYGRIGELEAFSTGGLATLSKHETDDRVQIGLSYKFDKGLLQMASGLLHGN